MRKGRMGRLSKQGRIANSSRSALISKTVPVLTAKNAEKVRCPSRRSRHLKYTSIRISAQKAVRKEAYRAIFKE